MPRTRVVEGCGNQESGPAENEDPTTLFHSVMYVVTACGWSALEMRFSDVFLGR